MADRIQHRRDTAARWAQYNPILLEGEIGYVTDNPNQYKIGDGVNAWNALPLRGYSGTVSDGMGSDETSVMSQKSVTKAIDVINVSLLFPIAEANETYRRVFNSRAEARAAVPISVRKSGAILVYQTIDEGWVREKNISNVGGTVDAPTANWTFWKDISGGFAKTTDVDYPSNLVKNLSFETWTNAVSQSSYDQETDVFGEGVITNAKKIVYKDTITAEQGCLGVSNVGIITQQLPVGSIFTVHLIIHSNQDINPIIWNYWSTCPLTLLTTTALKLSKGVNEIDITFRTEEPLEGNTRGYNLWAYGDSSWANAELTIHPDSCVYVGRKRNSVVPSELQKAKDYTDEKVDTYEEMSFLYAIVDEDNTLLFAIKVDGSVYWQKSTAPDILSILNRLYDLEQSSSTSVEDLTPFLYVILDAEDKVVFGIDISGNVHGVLEKYFDNIDNTLQDHEQRLKILEQGTDEDVKIIPCWGDSLTAANQYEAEMRTQLGSGYNVVNCGVGGENSQMIAGRQGGIPFYLVDPVTIPADGSEVELGPKTDNNLALLDATGTEVLNPTPLLQGQGTATVNPVTIEDVECTLRWTGTSYNDPNGRYTLKLNTATSQNHTTFAKAMIFTNGAKVYRNPYAMVIWIGQNGGWSNNPETLVSQFRKIIDFAGCPNYICLGLHTGNASSRADLEAAMLSAFGDRYINLRDYCATRAMSDAGLTPTEADIQAMAVGACPPTLIPDGTHMSAAGYKLVGEQIMNRFRYLGYIK